MLKPQGRLVFFLPTITEEYEEVDIDTMICDGMEVVANSLQDFGNWGRRVRLSHHIAGQNMADSTFSL
jgi:tRNA (guanine10-N2)-methyltransferase